MEIWRPCSVVWLLVWAAVTSEAILIPDPFSMWPVFFLWKPVVIHVFVLMLLYWELKWVLPFFIEL